MNERHHLTVSLLKVFDLCIVVITFTIATIAIVKADQRFTVAEFLSMRARVSNIGIAFLALFVCHVLFHVCGLYRSRRLSRHLTEVVDVLKAMTLTTACFVVLTSLFSIRMITIPFLTLFWIMSTLFLSIGRITLRLVAARLRIHGRDLRYMLILGTNLRAVEFARRIESNPQRGYRLLGFVDNKWPGLAEFTATGFQVVSDYGGLAEFLRRNVVDEMAIYQPFGSFHQNVAQVVDLCQQNGITMHLNPDIFGLKSTRLRVEEFAGDQYIATYTGLSEFWPSMIKRALDVTVAGTALLVLSPILLLAAICIKLTSPGPIFFLQERIGLNKRRFKIFKFRTMVPNAEKQMAALEKHNEAEGPVFKIKNDPRITGIGRFLRKSSIDELPQLLNVLTGDMSLVGPRPLPVRDYEGFNADWQRRRFSVQPGITCLWQVNGRSGISFDQWMLLDLQYMDEWSLWLDLKILARTVPAVLRGAGAV